MMKAWHYRRGCSLFASAIVAFLFVASATVYFYPNSLDPQSLPISLPNLQLNPSDWSRPDNFPIPDAASDLKPYSLENGWTFDVVRDERNFSLHDQQCSAAFPRFYHEIERAVKYRKDQNLGNITIDDVDISWRSDEILRAMIYDNQLYVIEAKYCEDGRDIPRALSLLHSIQRAIISSPVPVRNIEFSLGLSDWPRDESHRYPIWVLTRFVTDDYEKWVVPDFGYWSWPGIFMGEYSRMRNEIVAEEPEWLQKKPQAVWRGATATNKLRESLVTVSDGKPWADILPIRWDDPKSLDQGLTVPEHCDYQYVVHTEGHSYSGRAKYLLNCHSVSVVHSPDWIEPHTHLFRIAGPNQNVIAVNREFTDLDAKMKYYIKHPEEALKIADNSVSVFRDRYLTPAAQACYWRRLFSQWSNISFEPELYTEIIGHDGRKRKRTRGTTYETYVSSLSVPR